MRPAGSGNMQKNLEVLWPIPANFRKTSETRSVGSGKTHTNPEMRRPVPAKVREIHSTCPGVDKSRNSFGLSLYIQTHTLRNLQNSKFCKFCQFCCSSSTTERGRGPPAARRPARRGSRRWRRASFPRRSEPRGLSWI